MDLNIDALNVTLEGDFQEDGTALASQIERSLRRAFDDLSGCALSGRYVGDEVMNIILPPIDWDSETDIAGKIVELLKRAIGEAGV